MTPQEFEENARIVSGDPTWTLDNRIEDVTNSAKDWEDFWYNSESDGREIKTTKHDRYVDSVLNGGVICKRESMLSD